jgi:hypothetical protein
LKVIAFGIRQDAIALITPSLITLLGSDRHYRICSGGDRTYYGIIN